MLSITPANKHNLFGHEATVYLRSEYEKIYGLWYWMYFDLRWDLQRAKEEVWRYLAKYQGGPRLGDKQPRCKIAEGLQLWEYSPQSFSNSINVKVVTSEYIQQEGKCNRVCYSIQADFVPNSSTGELYAHRGQIQADIAELFACGGFDREEARTILKRQLHGNLSGFMVYTYSVFTILPIRKLICFEDRGYLVDMQLAIYPKEPELDMDVVERVENSVHQVLPGYWGVEKDFDSKRFQIFLHKMASDVGQEIDLILEVDNWRFREIVLRN